MNEKHINITGKNIICKIDDTEAYKNEIEYRLNEYKEELKQSINNNLPLKDENFKTNFFRSLENIYRQVLNLRNEVRKAEY